MPEDTFNVTIRSLEVCYRELIILDTCKLNSGVGTGGAGGACPPPQYYYWGALPPQYILKLSYMHYIAICKLVVRRD